MVEVTDHIPSKTGTINISARHYVKCIKSKSHLWLRLSKFSHNILFISYSFKVQNKKEKF